MERYTNAELTDMYLACIATDCNGQATQWLYSQSYRRRQTPSHLPACTGDCPIANPSSRIHRNASEELGASYTWNYIPRQMSELSTCLEAEKRGSYPRLCVLAEVRVGGLQLFLHKHWLLQSTKTSFANNTENILPGLTSDISSWTDERLVISRILMKPWDYSRERRL
ncbi:hypothetical protein TNCV_4498121 [Trichonephila clavipes]|nr:hypothetical protein TNCV_4498121 [Trichonephila clavipes]